MKKYKQLSDAEIEHMISTIHDQVSFYNDISDDNTCLLVPDDIQSMNPLELCAFYYRVNESVMHLLDNISFRSFPSLEMVQELSSSIQNVDWEAFPYSFLS